MPVRIVPPNESVLRRSLAQLVSAQLWERRGDRIVGRALRGVDDPLPSPPIIAWRLARTLGVDARVARRWLDACVLFYAAADLLDDAEDGDVPWEEAPVARCEALELLFASQVALARVHPDPRRTRRLVRCFAEEGARMSRGQALDLAGTGRLIALDPLEIAREKSGAEFAAMLGGAALLAARPARTWREAGRVLGAVFQVFSDYRDVYVEGGADLSRAKPTLVLRPREVPAEALLLAHAGNLRAPARAAKARALLHPHACASVAAAIAEVEPLLRRSRHPFLRELAARAASLKVAAAMRVAPQRAVVPLTPDWERAVRAAEEFLRADPSLGEASEVHRLGLFGRAEVRADLFGPMFAEALMHEAGVSPARLAETLLERGARGGWRYYPGHFEIPPDADDVGVALQLGARLGGDRSDLDNAAALLLANIGRNGEVPTWLVTPGQDRISVEAPWVRRECPVVAAQAALGLWRWCGERARTVVRRVVRRLSRTLMNAAAEPSPSYAPVLVDAIAGWCLARLGAEMGDAPSLRSVLGAIAARLLSRRTLGSAFGSTLETALAARALLSLNALPAPQAVATTLLDAQDADGGFPPDPFFNTVPHHRPRSYGSRMVTTAAALAALRALPAPSPRVGSHPPREGSPSGPAL